MGLRPKRSESGQSQPQLRITKEGDVYLRKLLARKPGVLMHHLWATGEVYEPLRNAQETASRKKAA
jgi:transposase